MSYLLASIGRGLVTSLEAVFEYELVGQPGDEQDGLRERLAHSPDSVDLTHRLALAALRAGRWREAQDVAEQARRLAPRSSKPLIVLACIRDRLGDVAAASAHLRDAGRLDPNDASIAFAEGLCDERLGRMSEARLAYGRAALNCPHLRNSYERLAALAIRERAWPAAIEQYEHLARVDPDDLETLLTLGALHLHAGRATAAVEHFQQALFVEPETDLDPVPADLDDPDSLLRAIDDLQQTIRRQPGVAPLHVRLGDLFARAGNDEQAVAAYSAALETQPQFLEATVKLGTQHMRSGRLAQASHSFSLAIELNDRLTLAFVGLGMAQRAIGRIRESDATLDLAASLEPSTTLLFAEAARLALRESSPHLFQDDADERWLGEATRRAELLLSDAPNNAALRYRWGLLMRHAKRVREAAAAFEAAVGVHRGYARANVKLAICRRELDDFAGAIECFESALRLDDASIDTAYDLALLYARPDRFQLASEQFDSGAESEQACSTLGQNLTLLLESVGLVDSATATWEAIHDIAADPACRTRRLLMLDALRRQH